MKLIEAFRQRWGAQQGRKAPQAESADDGVPQGETTMKLSADEPSDRIYLLTPREYELFLLLLEGYTLKESAKQLSIKYSTANTHMTSVYKKLNVNSRAELIIRYRDAVKENI